MLKENDPEAYAEYLAKRRIRDKEWRMNNKDKVRDVGRKANARYAKRHPDRIRKNKLICENRRRARKKMAGGSFTHDQWIELCEKYNNSYFNYTYLMLFVKLSLDNLDRI